MRIIFFGSTEFSVEILSELLDEGLRPVLIVTQKDRPAGRGLKLGQTKVKQFALENKLDIEQPQGLQDKDFIRSLKEKAPDMYIVVSYGKILLPEILDLPRLFALGIHPSLLPKYRGAAPINWALINGEAETGVTLFKLDRKMDEGEIIDQRKVKINPDDDFLTLSKKIYELSRTMLCENLWLIEQGKFSSKPQSSVGLSLAPKIDKKTARLDWGREAAFLKNLIRGIIPAPCAWSSFRDKKIKFWKAGAEDSEVSGASAGEVVFVSKDVLKINTGAGLLIPLEVQPEGKRTMKVKEFINGYRPRTGERFC